MTQVAHRKGTRKKPVKNPVRRVTNRNGGSVVPGNPGNRGGKKGRSGRKPDAYRDLCRDLITNAMTVASVRRILKNDKHPHFATVYKHLAEHAYGKPAQPLTGKDNGPIAIRIIRENPARVTE